MNRQIVVVAASLLLLAPALAAQNVCPCIPADHAWIATPCETWNCAQSAMILANGDPYTIAIPTANDSVRWIILRKMATGTTIQSPENAIDLDSFDSLPEAAARFSAIDPVRLPMVISAVDGKVIVVSFHDPVPRRRAVKR